MDMQSSITDIPKSPEMIFHLAADTDTSIRDHDAINQTATRNLIEASLPLSPGCRIQFTSSIAVGDHRADGVHFPCREDTKLLRPYHRYGRAKLATEMYLTDVAAANGAQLTIIRLCAIYGRDTRNPGLFANVRNLVDRNAWIARLDYPGKMSFTYVEDIASALVLVSQHPPERGKCEIFTPVGEVLRLAQLLEKYSFAMRKPYLKIDPGELLWNLCRAAAKAVLHTEQLWHYKLYNKIWQLSLTVENSFWNESDKWRNRFPDFRFHCLEDCFDEMIK